MVYHSNIPSDGEQHACGFALLPLNTKTRGPAKKTDGASLSAPPVGFTALTRPGAGEDVVDEALTYFRANVLYRKFDVQGTSDRTLIYLTLYISACLRKLESASNPAAAQKALYTLAVEPFAIPGDAQWPLGGLFSPPATKEEADLLRAYLKQAREEVGLRLVGRCFSAEGQPNKWWLAFSRRKFMNAELR